MAMPKRSSIILFLISISTSVFSQFENLKLELDSIEIIEFVVFKEGNKQQIIASDQYFIYKSQLFYNAVESYPEICNTKHSDPLNKIGRLVDSTIFYRELFNKPTLKQINIDTFLLKYNSVFRNDSLKLFEKRVQNCSIFIKQVYIAFCIYECNSIDINSLSGPGVHNKMFEKYLFPVWKGKFILPLYIRNTEKNTN